MPLQNCRFRLAVPSDAPMILAMQRRLAIYCHADMTKFGNTATKIAQALRDVDHVFGLIATYDGKPAGYTLGHKISVGLPWGGAGCIYVEDIFVEEAYRHGHGIGTAMLAYVATRAREMAEADGIPEAASMRLDSSKLDNEATQSYYRKLGFATDSDNFRISGHNFERLRRRSTILL